jgi:hypothetical protein
MIGANPGSRLGLTPTADVAEREVGTKAIELGLLAPDHSGQR